MNIYITGTPPNSFIRLEAESSAERFQLVELRRQAKSPRTRADAIEGDDALMIRLEALPMPPMVGTARDNAPDQPGRTNSAVPEGLSLGAKAGALLAEAGRQEARRH